MSEHASHSQNTPAKDCLAAVEIKDGGALVMLADGRVDWQPARLASLAYQCDAELHHYSVDWTDLDEGLDIQGC